MIELEGVSAYYRHDASRRVLDEVCLNVPRDRTMVLLGSSGAGKSTVLKAILRLIEPASGIIRIDGVDTHSLDRVALRRMIGMVFQGVALFPHLNVRDNIGLPLRLAGMKRAAIHARVDELMDLVEIDPGQFATRFPHRLSGGQQQRVGVARALAPNPAYLLMDEPFGALDALTRRHLQDALKILRTRLNITILFVTHDVMEAVALGDSIAVMDRGRVVQTGTARQLMEHPADATVRDLVSRPLAELGDFVSGSVR